MRWRIGARMDAQAITASLEAGYPIWLTPSLRSRPRGQFIWQRFHFEQTADPFTTLRYNLDDSLFGRVGLRLQNEAVAAPGVRLQFHLLTNLWQAFKGTDASVFNNAVTLQTPFEARALEYGGGVVLRFGNRAGIFAQGSYTTNLGGAYRETIQGTAGVRFTWWPLGSHLNRASRPVLWHRVDV
jgi:outer membrane autotransporter protein